MSSVVGLVLVALAVLGGMVVAVAAAGAVTVAGLSVMSVLLVAGTLVTAHKVGEAIWPDVRPRPRAVAPRHAAHLDEVVVHAEVVDPPRRAIAAEQRVVAEEWAARWSGEAR